MTAISTIRPADLRFIAWRRRDAVVARLRHRSLDRRLATGEPAHLDPLLTVRAAQLATTEVRDCVAARWDELAARTRAAADDATADRVGAVAETLRADRLVLARGVAYAATMTGTAGAAIERLHAGGEDIVAAIANAAVAAMG